MINKLKNILGKEIIPGFKGKFVHGKDMTLAFWKVKKGSTIPPHEHIHEQTLYVKSGTFELEINKQTNRSEEHTSELQSHHDLVCRLLLEKKKNS